MKKLGLRWAAGLLGVGLLLTGGVLALGRGDSLISLSFLEEKFIPDMVEQGGQIHEEKMSQSYDKALEELSQVRAGESEVCTVLTSGLRRSSGGTKSCWKRARDF